MSPHACFSNCNAAIHRGACCVHIAALKHKGRGTGTGKIPHKFCYAPCSVRVVPAVGYHELTACRPVVEPLHQTAKGKVGPAKHPICRLKHRAFNHIVDQGARSRPEVQHPGMLRIRPAVHYRAGHVFPRLALYNRNWALVPRVRVPAPHLEIAALDLAHSMCTHMGQVWNNLALATVRQNCILQACCGATFSTIERRVVYQHVAFVLLFCFF